MEEEVTIFYCKECKWHGYDVFARGVCYHPCVDKVVGDYEKACNRFEQK